MPQLSGHRLSVGFPRSTTSGMLFHDHCHQPEVLTPAKSNPTELNARMTMPASTIIETTAPLCRKNRLRTI
jgi:hypothetical protein